MQQRNALPVAHSITILPTSVIMWRSFILLHKRWIMNQWFSAPLSGLLLPPPLQVWRVLGLISIQAKPLLLNASSLPPFRTFPLTLSLHSSVCLSLWVCVCACRKSITNILCKWRGGREKTERGRWNLHFLPSFSLDRSRWHRSKLKIFIRSNQHWTQTQF